MNKRYKILIVDDSMTAMLYTSNIVREAGYDLVEAINGKEALRKLRNDSFDMIISDILMPEMNGFQFLKFVKEDPDLRNIPFIFHTATYNSDKDIAFGVKLGVDAYIQKFKDPTELSELIQDIFKELELGKFISNKPKIEQEGEVFKLYSERLINKLEKKNLDLEKEIIEHKKATEDLRQFEKIVDSTSIHMSFVNNEYIYQAVSHSYLKAHKRKREQIVGHSIAEMLGSEIFDSQIKEKIDNCFSGEIVKYENWFNFDGIGKRYMQVSYYPYYNEENIISGVIVDSIDITERKEAETKLANKTMLLDNITNRASNISIITTDLDLKITTYNPFAEKFFGYAAEQVIGKTVHEMHFMENIEPERLTKGFKIADKTGEYNYIVKQQLPSGKRVLSSRITKILNPDGKLAGYSLFTHDVTKQVLAEEKLLQGDNYLRALNKTNELLIGNNPRVQLQKFVQTIGEAAHSSRTYIFKNHKDENGNLLLSQIAEYVIESIKPEINNPQLQNLSYADFIPHWQNALSKGEIMNGKIAQFPEPEKGMLEQQEIKAILLIPIMIEKEFWGFIGFDNCINDNEWETTEIEYLKASAEKLSTKLKEHRKQKQIENENKRFRATMDSMDAVVYVADIQTHELLFFNKYAKQNWGDKVGEKCYITLQGLDKPCDFCTNDKLLDKNGNPKEPYVWEFQNTITKQWYQCRDRAIQWTDGSLVRLEIATDITARKETEQALLRNRNLLQEAQKFAHLGHWDLDIINDKLTWSDEVYRIFDLLPQEFGGTFEFFLANIHPDDRDKVKEAYTNSLKTKLPYEIEHRLLTKSGKIKYVLDKCVTKYDKSGNPLHSFGTVLDITDRRNAEEALKESEERYKRLVNNSNSLISEIDEDSYKITSCNLAFARMLNKEPEQLVGKNIKELLPPDVSQRRIGYGEKALKENKIQIFEDERNGRYFVNSFIPVITNEHRFFQTVSYDITDRKLAEQAIKANEERFRTVADYTYDWEYWESPKGKILYISPSCERITGYSPDEFKQNPELLMSIIHPDDINKWENHKHHSFDKAEIETIEFRIISKSGKEYWIGHVCQTIFNENNVNIGIRGSNRDITEKKNTDQKLKASEDRLSKTLIAANDGMWDWDLITNIVYFNPRYYEMAGYAINEFPYELDEFQKRIHPDDVENVMTQAQLHIEGKTARFKVEFRFKKKNGDWLWVLGRGLIVERDKNNKPLRFMGTHSDIIDRKKAENALKSSEENYRLLTETMKDVVVKISTTGELLYVSPSIEEFGAYKPKEEIGKHISNYFANKIDLIRALKLLADILITKRSGKFEFLFKPQDRKPFFVEHTYIPLIKSGKVYAIQMVLRDISDRKEAENALKASEEKYKYIFENSPVGIATFSLEGEVLNANNSLLKILGSPSIEATKKLNLLELENIKKTNFSQDFTKCITSKKAIKNEGYYTIVYGREIYMHYYLSPILDINNKAKGVQCIFEDFTKQNEMDNLLHMQNKELAIAKEKAEESNKTKDKFFSIISHDLRSPFNAILGFSDLLLENHKEYKDSVREKYIKAIDNSGRKAYELLDNLLVWANTQTDGISFEPQKLDLKKTVKKLISLNEYNAVSKNIKLSYSISKEISIYADLNMLNIILRNLISNAIKFTNSNGLIIVNAEQENNKVIISVSDTGVGIKKSRLQKIFDISVKTSTIGTANEKGTGLGLLLCKEFVEKHGGKIWVESEIEKGSKFTFSMLCCSNKEIEEQKSDKK